MNTAVKASVEEKPSVADDAAKDAKAEAKALDDELDDDGWGDAPIKKDKPAASAQSEATADQNTSEQSAENSKQDVSEPQTETAKQQEPVQKPDEKPLPQPAGPARLRKRHGLVKKTFLGVVVVPVLLATAYLTLIAKDQYASHLGFFVRAEDQASPVEMLGGIAQLSGSSSGSDTDVLFEFIQSQRIVRLVDEALDLKAMYHMPSDPIFGVKQDATIEELQSFWKRVVKVFYDSGAGLIEVRVTAFRPEDAKAVADQIYDESSRMINDLTAIARSDATSYARAELDAALERLREARTAIQTFRLRTQIIDPEADILGRMGLLNSLQTQLASAQIELDLYTQTARAGDPRLVQARRRVEVIEQRLADERERFSSEEGTISGAYADLIGEYERLSVDRKFAETTYLSALANLDAATAEASRKSRYLAAYIEPTLAESAQHPQRLIIIGTIAVFLLGLWVVATMIYYSVRDRR